MSIEAIRCPGCKNLVNVADLDKHYSTGHKEGIVAGATTITTANPVPSYPPGYNPGGYNPFTGYVEKRSGPKIHPFDSPVWGPLLRRFFPHILFGAFVIGAIVGILLW